MSRLNGMIRRPVTQQQSPTQALTQPSNILRLDCLEVNDTIKLDSFVNLCFTFYPSNELRELLKKNFKVFCLFYLNKGSCRKYHMMGEATRIIEKSPTHYKFSVGNLITRREDQGYVELPKELFEQVLTLTPFLSYNILKKIGELPEEIKTNKLAFLCSVKDILFTNIPKFEDYTRKYKNIAKLLISIGIIAGLSAGTGTAVILLLLIYKLSITAPSAALGIGYLFLGTLSVYLGGMTVVKILGLPFEMDFAILYENIIEEYKRKGIELTDEDKERIKENIPRVEDSIKEIVIIIKQYYNIYNQIVIATNYRLTPAFKNVISLNKIEHLNSNQRFKYKNSNETETEYTERLRKILEEEGNKLQNLNDDIQEPVNELSNLMNVLVPSQNVAVGTLQHIINEANSMAQLEALEERVNHFRASSQENIRKITRETAERMGRSSSVSSNGSNHSGGKKQKSTRLSNLTVKELKEKVKRKGKKLSKDGKPLKKSQLIKILKK